MTFTDHTAPARPSVRNEPKSKFFPYSELQLYPLDPELAGQLSDEENLAGSLFAITVIQGLLTYNASYQDQFRGKPDPTCPWPLTPAQTSGFFAALYHLQQYIATLQAEPGG